MSFLKSVASKLKQGLARTRDSFVDGLRGLVSGRTVDAALLADIERTLLEADVGPQAAGLLVAKLRDDHRAGRIARGEDALAYLKRHVAAMWPEEDRRLRRAEQGPTVILVTGVNGVGKTTSIAKLVKAMQSEGQRVLVGACDTFRAGAVRQLEVWADRLGAEIVKGQEGGDPASVAFDACAAAVARGADVVILDTAGRLQTQDPLMRQLAKIRAVVGRQISGAPHETLLVLDATSGQNALRQAEAFAQTAGVSGILLSKLDGTARGGIVIAIRQATDIPVKLVGVGETPDDLQPFDPHAFAEALFGA